MQRRVTYRARTSFRCVSSERVQTKVASRLEAIALRLEAIASMRDGLALAFVSVTAVAGEDPPRHLLAGIC